MTHKDDDGSPTILTTSQCHLLVEVLEEDEAGGGAYDGGQPPDGGCVGDAQGEAFADHVVVPALVPVLATRAEIWGLRGQDQELSLSGDIHKQSR